METQHTKCKGCKKSILKEEGFSNKSIHASSNYKEKMKPKVRRRKKRGIIKIRSEINEVDNRKTIK